MEETQKPDSPLETFHRFRDETEGEAIGMTLLNLDGQRGDLRHPMNVRDGNEMGVRGWVPVAAKAGPTPGTLTVDLGSLPAGSKLAAVRYAVGSGGYNSSTGERLDRGLGSSRICCGPRVDTALQPCKPEHCPIKASGPGSLPASPFFAAIDWKKRRCQCFAPQECK